MLERIRRFLNSADIRTKLMWSMLLVSVPPLLVAVIYSVSVGRDLAYGYAVREQEHRVHAMAMDVERFLVGVQDDVLFLAHSEELSGMLRAEMAGDVEAYEKDRASLEREFQSLAEVKGVYDQVRYIDANGMEVVRVNLVNGQGVIVPRDQLQDKSHRYYFRDAISLPGGKVYVSPLDLNVEHGEIEIPFKPMIRYATPVWFNGRPAGVIVLNVLAGDFLDALSDRKAPDETVVMVDQDGYYLYHSRLEEKQWGRDLGTDITLAQDYPQLWPQVMSPAHERDEHKSVRVGGDLITFTSFSPPGTDAYRWALLSIRSSSSVLAPIVRFEWGVAGITAVALLAVWGFSAWSSKMLVRPVRRLADMAASMGRGDLESPISLDTADELGMLAQVLDRARLDLRRVYADLKEQVERAERRAVQLHTAALVAGTTAAILDVEELLPRVVRLIGERFGFYHAGVFLLDESGEWAVLRAASSEGGQRMLARGHRLRVGEQGIVGYVAATGEPRIALDVGEDAVFFDNPDLPETRSEVALPLRARGEVLGVLDVQSRERGAFTDEDMEVLQTLADQVAMAISNARLFRQVQERAEALERAYGEFGYQAWREMVRARGPLGFLYRRQLVSRAGDLWRPEMRAAARDGRAVRGEDGKSVAVPVMVRGRVIGVIGARKAEEEGEWSSEELALMESLADQLSVALEGARLYQDTQRRAAAERMIGEITTRIRETLDVETVLQTAVREMREGLGLRAVTVLLEGDEDAVSQQDGEVL